MADVSIQTPLAVTLEITIARAGPSSVPNLVKRVVSQCALLIPPTSRDARKIAGHPGPAFDVNSRPSRQSSYALRMRLPAGLAVGARRFADNRIMGTTAIEKS